MLAKENRWTFESTLFLGGGTQQILTSWFMLFVSSKAFVFDHLEAGGRMA